MSNQTIWSLAAAVLFTLFYLISFPVQAIKVRRITGKTPRLPRNGSAGWIGYTLVDLSLVTVLAGALLAAAEVLPVFSVPGGPVPRVAGLLLYAAGFLFCQLAQAWLGVLWRAGVREEEANPLITSGPFTRIRNPFFTGWIAVSVAVSLLSPNIVSMLGIGLLLVALHTLTRGVEEPYLSSVHGAKYDAYRRQAGRFLPRLAVPSQTLVTEPAKASQVEASG